MTGIETFADGELFFENAFDLMGVLSTSGKFLRVNPAFERVLGHSPAEMCASSVADFLHPEDQEKTRDGLERLAKGNPRQNSINRLRCKNGEYRWFSWNTKPRGENVYTIGRDITEQIAAEEEIRQLNATLAEKNAGLEQEVLKRVNQLRESEAQVQQLQKMDAIGRLAGGIAHDFNNMLGAISMYCDLLLEEAGKPTSVTENTEEIRKVTARAAALTRQLLIFSRKQVVQPQAVNLNPLIQQLEKMLARLIGETVKIQLKLAPNLESISIDPSQMEQVILNLVVNAKDALPSGGTITLETSNIYFDGEFIGRHLSVERGHYVQLSVQDNGTGMSKDTQDKLFEPFFTTKSVGKGTGLGLSTTYGIVKQSKGSIWVYSELGKGSVFKIYFPVAEAAVSPVLVPEPNLEAAPREDHTPSILLVEDDERLCAGYEKMLTKKGFKVHTAKNAQVALDICRNAAHEIDLLLTDIVMPGWNGLMLAQKVLEIRPDVGVLYMSGYTSDALENVGMDSLDSVNYIEKPFNTSSLLAKIEYVLSQRRENGKWTTNKLWRG